MLEIHIPESEFFNNSTEEFYYTKETTLVLEYSLLSIARWESKWRKAYIDPFTEKTLEETQDLIRCMTVNKNVDPLIYSILTPQDIDRVNDYINDPMTATEINTFKKNTTKRKITSEEIYYWMVAFGIPFECEKWHINRLFALIEICAVKSNNEKMSPKESAMTNMQLNEMRLRKYKTKG